MALRARLVAPPPERREWKWHETQWTSLSSALFSRGERRMEADNYLASGYGLRLALESQDRVVSFGLLARVWQPGRLKGTQVSPAYGKPYLAATQVFDLRPVPRKWLSIEQINDVNALYVKPKQILVTRSGSVGRATLAYTAHEDTLISDDLLRIVPRRPEMWGWVYAYLRSRQARAMMSAAQYGHVIKHLEVSHLEALPIPVLRDDLLEGFNAKVGRIVELRSKSSHLSNEAEQLYADQFPSFQQSDKSTGFPIQASEIFGHRRRLEASVFPRLSKDVVKAYRKDAREVVPLASIVERVFVPGRFKHIYGDGGSPYLDSADILEVNPDITKYVLSLEDRKEAKYKVEAGWLLIPCSGQVYGNLGQSVLATSWHQHKVLTNHIMRILPKKGVRSGYLQCVLGHSQLGRPQLIRFAFGSSVPEIASEDVLTVEVPRLGAEMENRLADMMEIAAHARAEADALENEIAAEAEALVDRFLAGQKSEFETLRLVAAPATSLEPDAVTGFPPETDFEGQMQEWRDNDLSHLGELPPFKWGEHGEPEVHPLRYVEGKGWVTS
jgi:type I restriction enzyme, S subunit